MSKTKQKKSSAGKSIAIFFIVFIILEGLIIFGLKTLFKTEDSAPSFGGYSFFLMDSENMSPTVPKNTLVVAVNGKPDENKISCAILCNNVGEEGTTVAWLTEIGSKGDTVNGIVYTVYQDNVGGGNGTDRYRYYDVDSENVIGVASQHYVTAGKIVSFVITPFGMAICLAVPLVMLVLLELVVAVTGRSDDDGYEEEYAPSEQFFNNQGNQQPQRGQNGGNVALDDFLYGGNGDEVYNGGKPNADYAEEFDGRRGGAAAQQQRPMPQNNQRRGRPDFSVNDEPEDEVFAENDPFGEEDDFRGFDAPSNLGGAYDQTQEDSGFYHPDEEVGEDPFDDDQSVSGSEPAPEQPNVEREYYEKASKIIEGDDYKPQPVQNKPQQPASQFVMPAAEPQPEAPVKLDKPARQAAPAPRPAGQPQPRQTAPGAPTPRRRPSQPPQGAPRRRPAGSPPPRPGQSAAGGQRRRPAPQRPGQPRRAPHRDANAALADLTKRMQNEQQKLGGNKPQ